MTALAAARALALGRVVVGVALVAAPEAVGRGWLGADAQRPGTQVALRALGIRDLLLGGLTLHVAARPGVGPRTVATCGVADAVDFAATLVARDKLPAAGANATLAIAGGAAVGSVVLAAALRD